MKRSPMLIVFITVFLDLLGFGILIPLAPFFANEYGAEGVVFSLLMAVYSVMQFLFSPVWGRLSDRVGRRPIMLMSIAASTLGYALFALSQSLLLLFASRIIAGIGAANISTAQAIIADTTTPEKRTKGMGLIGMAIGLGFTFGPGLAWLLLDGDNFAPVFWVAAGLSGFDLILAYFILPETCNPSGSEAMKERRFSLSRFKIALALPYISTLLISSLIFYTAFSIMEVMLGLFGKMAFDLSPKGFSGMMFGVGLILAFVQGGIVHHVAKRIGELNTLRIGLMGIMAGLIVMGFSQSLTVLIISTCILAAFVGLATPALTSMISQFSPSDMQGGILGLNQSMASLGRILGPVIGGISFDYIHIRAPFPIAALLVFFAIILLYTIRGSQPEPDTESIEDEKEPSSA